MRVLYIPFMKLVKVMRSLTVIMLVVSAVGTNVPTYSISFYRP